MREGRLEEIKEATEDAWFVSEVRPFVGELVEEVETLRGRLEAVCDVVSDADAFNGVVEATAIMGAVRGESERALKVGDRVRMNRNHAGMEEGEEAIVIALTVAGTNLVMMDMVGYEGRYNMEPEFLDKVK